MPINEEERRRAQKRAERLAQLLDNSLTVPGTGIRFGVDALIGLLPGIGDTLGAVLSSTILVEASRLGAPPAVLLKMAANVGIDTLLGAVPLAGDIFDIAWRANLRNVKILENYLQEPQRMGRRSRLQLWGVGLAAVVFVGLLAVGSFVVLRALWQAVSGS